MRPEEPLRGVRRVLHLTGTRRDLDEELAYHFERSVEELMARGLSRGEAEAEARRRFGDEAGYRRRLVAIDRKGERRRRWRDRFQSAGEATGSALRSIRRSPGLSGGIILAFALGIGANATMFGIVDRLLLRAPPHIRQPEAVRRLVVERYLSFMNRRITSSTITYPDYGDLARAAGFASVAAISQANLTVGQGEAAVQIPAVLATGNFFPTLGVTPALGRFFGPDDDRRGVAGVAVLGWGFWQRRYGGSRDVLGRTLDFGGGPYTIIGVAPRGFTGIDLRPVDLWLPLVPAGIARYTDQWLDARGYYWIQAVARLAPGATASRAEAQATALLRAGREAEIGRGVYDAHARVIAAPLLAARGSATSPETKAAKVATWLLGVALIVLLIACVNVANLLLARTIRQRRELGVRLALGISRARLVGQIVLEGVMLSLLGGAAALLLAHWGGAVIRRTLFPDVAWDALGLDGPVLGLVLALSLLVGMFSALLPALQASRRNVGDALRMAAGGITRSASRVRSAFSLLQAALSVILLVGAGLFVHSLARVQQRDLGFQPRDLLYAQPVMRRGTPDPDRAELVDEAIQRLGRLPGVAHAAGIFGTPLLSRFADSLFIDGVDSIPQLPSGGPYFYPVTADFLPTMGMRVAVGRGFTAGDVDANPPVAVINRTMARVIWPGRSPLGTCLHLHHRSSPCLQIIGVAEDLTEGIDNSAAMSFYLLATRGPDALFPSSLLIRARGSAQGVGPAVRRELLSLDPRIRYVKVEPIQSLIDPQTRSWKLGASLFSLFGLLALVVAGIGLYSVLAFDVAQRTREIGLRTALGATRSGLVRLVLTRSLRVTISGVALGVLAALVLAPRIEPLLFQTPARDPLTFGVVIGTLLLVAVLAGSLPAWRAARVDPNVALRAE